MYTLLIILFLLCLLASIACLLISIIKYFKKKPVPILKWIALALFIIGFFLLELFSYTGLFDLLLLTGVFLIVIDIFLAIILLGAKILKKDRKNLRIITCCLLVVGVSSIAISFYIEGIADKKKSANNEIHEVETTATLDFEVVDGEEPIEVKEYYQKYFDKDEYIVYDSDYYYLLFGKESPTAKDCINAIKNNDDLPEEYKEYFTDFINRIDKTYPGINYEVIYHNLQTLQVTVLSQTDYFTKALDLNSAGIYFRNENHIYIPEGTEYIEGEWGFQVLIHEFCHAVRSYYETDKDGYFALSIA